MLAWGQGGDGLQYLACFLPKGFVVSPQFLDVIPDLTGSDGSPCGGGQPFPNG